jgi:hypothetical protein
MKYFHRNRKRLLVNLQLSMLLNSHGELSVSKDASPPLPVFLLTAPD